MVRSFCLLKAYYRQVHSYSTHILCSYCYECNYTTHYFIRASIVYSHRCLQAQNRPPVDPIAALPRQGRTRDPGAGARWPTLLLPSPACCPDWGAASEPGWGFAESGHRRTWRTCDPEVKVAGAKRVPCPRGKSPPSESVDLAHSSFPKCGQSQFFCGKIR